MARSKRILKLAQLLKGFHTALDIGTDHGYVLQEAFNQGFIKYGIASDLRLEPLNQARENLKDYPVITIQSDGFLAIDQTFDVVVIAGMGSYLIAEILDHAKEGDIHYILQANDKQDILRDYLVHHDFRITDEHYLYDGHDYIIIEAKRGKMILSNEDLILGPILKTKAEAKKFYQRRLTHYERLLSQVDLKRSAEIERIITIYRRGLSLK